MARVVLDHRIQIRRGSLVDDGLQSALAWNEADPASDNLGPPIWAGRVDLSIEERAAAGWIEATVVARFTVRASAFAGGITAKDRLACGHLTYDIKGIQHLGRARLLEITAVARADR